MNFTQLLKEFALYKNIPELKTESGNHLSLTFNNVEFNIGYIDTTADIIIVSYLGAYPETEKEDFFRHLLSANFTSQVSALGTLALCDGDEVTLNFKRNLQSCDHLIFDSWLKALAKESQEWKNSLATFSPEYLDDKLSSANPVNSFLKV